MHPVSSHERHRPHTRRLSLIVLCVRLCIETLATHLSLAMPSNFPTSFSKGNKITREKKRQTRNGYTHNRGISDSVTNRKRALDANRQQRKKNEKEIALNYMDDRKRHRYHLSRKIFAYASNKSIMWHIRIQRLRLSMNMTDRRYIYYHIVFSVAFFAVLSCGKQQ